MPCYIQKTKPPTKTEYKAWQDLGYTGTWEKFCENRKLTEGQTMFICGDLGAHCADCSAVGDFLCDFPVGDGKTCDRPICEDHSKEIGPDLHYCDTHYGMWCDFKDSGGINSALRNVIAFKSEK
jgi:hypothetical protein